MPTAGSTTAYVALLLWIPLSALVISSARTPQIGFLLVFLGGVMFLPERTSLMIPLLPPLNKQMIIAIAAWFGLAVTRGALKPANNNAATRLALLLLLSAIGTWITNRDAVVHGPRVQPGQTYKELIFAYSSNLFQIVLPFSLGLRVFRTREDLEALLRGLLYATLIYTPLVLLEVRLAPFLHTKVYGYFQHSFGQSRRGEGFRAFVFMAHGLSVSFFLAQGIIVASAFAKIRDKVKAFPLSPWWLASILGVTLALSVSTAPIVYALVVSSLVLWTKPARQMAVARLLSIGVLLYPLARLNDYFPTEWLLGKVAPYSFQRSESLRFRFMNEDILLEKALTRRWFGWGWSGRHHIINEEGRNVSVADGEWIIHMGQGGIVKFLIIFGLLTFPIWRASRVWPNVKDEVLARFVAVLALLLAMQSVDMLPNASWNSLGYLLAGALTSVAASLRSPRVAAA